MTTGFAAGPRERRDADLRAGLRAFGLARAGRLVFLLGDLVMTNPCDLAIGGDEISWAGGGGRNSRVLYCAVSRPYHDPNARLKPAARNLAFRVGSHEVARPLRAGGTAAPAKPSAC